MKTPQSGGPGGGGFTLIEVTVAMAIMVLIVGMLAVIVGQVNKAWASGQARVESFQNGRAILELIARELSQAVISNKLQFIQNPPDLAGGSNLTTMLSGSTPQVADSDSLFWQMPYVGNTAGSICEVGYLLTSNTATKPAKYQLQRYFVPPDNSGTNNALHMFRIYDGPTTYISAPAYTSTTPWPLITGAPWLTQAQNSTLTLAQVRTNFQNSLSVLSDGVIAFWVRCLDKNGNPIPWLSQQTTLYTGAFNPQQTKFNSAACFSYTALSGTNCIQYGNPAPPSVSSAMVRTSAMQANLLPDSVEITVITLDAKTIKSGLSIPSQSSVWKFTDGPYDIPTEISNYMASLVNNHITTGRLFSTTVHLVSAGYSPITR